MNPTNTAKRLSKGISQMFSSDSRGNTPKEVKSKPKSNNSSPNVKSNRSSPTAEASKTPRTPLTQISKTLQSRSNFQKLRTAPSFGVETEKDKEEHMMDQARFRRAFWRILVLTAILSSTLSFAIDNFTWVTGIWREQFTTFSNIKGLVGITISNAILVAVARIIVRTTMECEGSGFPEMKAMLFGHVLDNYLNLRVLAVKATGLAMLVSAGLPVGKEGPNCHMAACISRSLDPEFMRKRERSASGQAQITKLLLAAVSVGVGASFSAPIGGVIFSLELMLPQLFDFTSYWGCFAAAVIGSLTYEAWRSWFAGADTLLPLISTNVLPGEGNQSKYPLVRLLLDIGLGAICGLLGGIWIKMHSKCNAAFKNWRLKGTKSTPALPTTDGREPLLGGEPKQGLLRKIASSICGFQWRDIVLCVLVTVLNTVWAAYLPFLNGKPQPLLLSDLFDKTMLQKSETWTISPLGVGGTILACLVMKWIMTIMSLSLSMPTGVVAPTMIIGGLIGRWYGTCIPEGVRDMMLTTSSGTSLDPDSEGAFYARFAIIGAAAFCAAVCRAFAMAITVFEVLAIPNEVIPMCSATLVAIFVANKVELPFFDRNLANRGLGGIPALTFESHSEAPAFSIMKKLDVNSECLPWKTRLFDMNQLLKTHHKKDFFPIVRPLEPDQAILVGSITRANLNRLIDLLDPNGSSPEVAIDLTDPELQRPLDGSAPMVEGCPPHVSPSTTVREIYLIMKVAHGENVVYITNSGCLLGYITFSSLMSHKQL